MASTIQSPEVVISIVFGILATALGVAQLLLFFIHGKRRSYPRHNSQSIPGHLPSMLAHYLGTVTEPQESNFTLHKHLPSPPTSVFIFTFVNTSLLVLANLRGPGPS
jgi:hypothetical protein